MTVQEVVPTPAGRTPATCFEYQRAESWADAVERDLADAKALGVFGTPTFFVNGLPLAGALPFPTFRGLIDTQVDLAKAKVAAGTPPERVYAELVKALEDRFSVQIADPDLKGIASVGDAIALVERLQGAAA